MVAQDEKKYVYEIKRACDALIVASFHIKSMTPGEKKMVEQIEAEVSSLVDSLFASPTQ